ncbi:LamB/YcsF family protein [Paenibacillus puerhi]|uniref:LamB/YcsF family protein n=1 Tax=Paenibacillus puerhi TaxID=2692622 RepID=UPI001357DBC4|nr:5-oxoprolinase subunit PxpA [Paenibacillus puerhi]
MRTIDLNCDMGESFGIYKLGIDEEVMPWITSANIACGFHAGDPSVMDRTVRLATEHGVGIGVHMGYPDLAGFGRREMSMSRADLLHACIYQIGALEAFCRKHGTGISHVKPHGSMNNMADKDAGIADAIAESVALTIPGTPMLAKPGSELLRAAQAWGLPVIRELYADRAYQPDGTLSPRSLPGSVIHDPGEAAEHAVRMVVEGRTKTLDGQWIDVQGDSLCVHGDTRGALEMIRRIRTGLEKAGVRLARP